MDMESSGPDSDAVDVVHSNILQVYQMYRRKVFQKIQRVYVDFYHPFYVLPHLLLCIRTTSYPDRYTEDWYRYRYRL